MLFIENSVHRIFFRESETRGLGSQKAISKEKNHVDIKKNKKKKTGFFQSTKLILLLSHKLFFTFFSRSKQVYINY